MTERLYYHDSYLQEFEATVVRLFSDARGRAVVLDRSAFYPESGGQPPDGGWLGVARVIGVEEGEADDILHFIEGDLVPGPVHGCIDWARRYDHMQQHSGQHLLSQVFVKKADAPTLSFHLGREISTIDIATSDLSPARILAVEEEANRLVYENRPIHIGSAGEGDRENLNLRKEPTRMGPLRIIEIDGYDRSACGGTHVRSTGELGPILIPRVERYKSNFRVEFVCGWRAVQWMQQRRDILDQLTRKMSTAPEELPVLFDKLVETGREQGRQIHELTDRVSEVEAELLFQTAEKHGETWVVQALLAPCPANHLKFLASKLLRKGSVLVLLACTSDPAFVVVANSSSLPIDSGKILAECLKPFGGRGGGRPDLAQGGGIPAASAGELLEAIYRQVFSS